MQHPPNIPDDVLFRTLLQTPRPKKSFYSNLFDCNFEVQAISSSEIADYQDPKEIDMAVIWKSLLKDGKPAFSSIESIRKMSYIEYTQLYRNVLYNLSQISPMINYSDSDVWIKKLEVGAKHHSNYIITRALGSCYDVQVIGDRIHVKESPEQYFGILRKDLLDCHWMVYWAAVKTFQNFTKTNNSTDEKKFVTNYKEIAEGKQK